MKNQCSDTEAEVVAQYFKEHPEEIERYMPLGGWLINDERRLGTAISEKILQPVREAYNDKRKAPVAKSILRYAVAATVTALVVLTYLELFNSKQAPRQAYVAATDTCNIRPLKTEENKTALAIQVKLPDGSVAVLYPHSSLQYLSAFAGDNRNLYLNGKALFKVQKDLSRPFTVYAAGIAATALGTEFLVTEMENKKVSIRLLKGSVKVWPQSDYGNTGVVLRPGEEVITDSGHFNHYSLKRGLAEGRINMEAGGSKGNNPASKQEDNLAFKNASLKSVFKRIEEKFEVTIDYQSAIGDKDKLFTGAFLESDSLEFICKTICGLHGLKYRVDGNTVTISAQ